MAVIPVDRTGEALAMVRKDPRRAWRSLSRLLGPMRRDYRRLRMITFPAAAPLGRMLFFPVPILMPLTLLDVLASIVVSPW